MRVLAGILVVLLLGSSVASATSIVAVRNSDEIVIGADSKTTLTLPGSGTGYAGSIPKCKIVQAGDLFFASAGFAGISSADFPGHADPDSDLGKVIAEGLSGSGSIGDRVSNLEKILAANLSRIAEELMKENSAFFLTRFLTHPVYTIIVSGSDHGELLLMVRTFSLVVSPSGSLSFAIGRFDCPGNCDEPVTTVLEGRTGAIRNYLKQHVLFLHYADPVTAVRDLVGLEIQEDPSFVGPPVDILRLTRKGAEWVQKKPLCPDIRKSMGLPESGRRSGQPLLFGLQ